MMELYEKYVGLVFDNRYRIERVIGIGGMAIVFKATDLLMRRVVAVKILKDEISGDEQSVKRFTNESRAVAMLSHQNIVNIYDVSVRENIKYIVMEFVEGITLKNYMEHREVLNLREIISYTTQILRALDHAHKKGIIHRDIKPQNIMLLKNGVIKVMDFGIAKLPNAETITMTDKAIGTVYYISPEQVTGGDIDARSDLYSLGAMMYEMAVGELPFTADTPVSVALMQVNDAPTPPREINPHIPVGLEQIILKAMEKNPDDRYQSAEEMLGHLLKLRENPKIIFKENNKSVKAKQAKQKDGDKKHKTSRSMFPIIMGVTLAFLITAGISGYYVVDRLFINGTSNNYIEIPVETFADGYYSEDLADWFEKSERYTLADVIYEYSGTIEKGKIISQEPKANEIRKILPGKQKCEVTLTVSLGEKTITLKDYTAIDYRTVDAELRKEGLRVTIEYITSDVYEIGHVIRTEPAAGTVAAEGDSVVIYVSQGVDTVKTMVPNFVGLSEAQALIKLMENDLSVGKVTYVKSTSTAGSVVEQSVNAWLEVPQYSEVDFKVSGGASYSGDGTTIPTAEDMQHQPTEPETTKPGTSTPEPDTDDNGGEDSSDSWETEPDAGYNETEDDSEDPGYDDDWFGTWTGGNLFKDSE
ncbi:MAG: protein kinase [Eubacteriales bacterium]